MPTSPLVTVLVAVHDGERFLRAALDSALGQTVGDIELLVVDDGSTDATAAILDEVDDPRLRVLRNEERRGLAASLNRGLEDARGAFVARLDADDIAMPRRLERQLRRLAQQPSLAVVGSAVVDVDGAGKLGQLHVMPRGRLAVLWASLFSSPFLHPSVLVDRRVLERHELRYETGFEETEDYELWARLLDVADGDNLPDPLVLYRVHAGQASQRRGGLQRGLQRQVALARISDLLPALLPEEVDLAWRVGIADPIDHDQTERAAWAYQELVRAFEGHYGRTPRSRAARDLLRLAGRSGGAGVKVLAEAIRLDPALAAHVAHDRRVRKRLSGQLRREAENWFATLQSPVSRPIRVAAVFPEPTPYRTPLLDRIAALDEIDLEVVYAAESVVAGRSWQIERRHEATVLRGLRAPGAERVFRHDYPVTPGIARALGRARPDVVVVSGWSTFAAQAAIAWCRLRRIPYVLVVESHDAGPRAGWRRTVKGAVVPSVVGGAAAVLVTGSLARASMIARGAPPERIRVFANTVDVEAFGERVEGLAGRRSELRADLGVDVDDVVVLSVARLGPEKRLDVLLRAVAAAGDSRLVVVLAGEGQERERLEDLARELGVRAVLTGDVEWKRIVELYAAADVFALLSERETWGVVVNEAAACGLPLVLSDRVGAAHDLLRDGENGVLVRAGDVDEAAAALSDLAADADRRRAMGSRSRDLARDWGYGPSVDGFLAAVREAIADRR